MTTTFQKDDIVKISPCKSTGYRAEYAIAARSEFVTDRGPMVKIVGFNKALPMRLVRRMG